MKKLPEGRANPLDEFIGVHNEGEKTSPVPYLVIQINCAPVAKILSNTLLKQFNWILKLNITIPKKTLHGMTQLFWS